MQEDRGSSMAEEINDNDFIDLLADDAARRRTAVHPTNIIKARRVTSAGARLGRCLADARRRPESDPASRRRYRPGCRIHMHLRQNGFFEYPV